MVHGGSILLILTLRQGLLVFDMPNWSNQSRPRINRKLSATAVIFARGICKSLNLTDVFNIPRVSTTSLKNDLSLSCFFSEQFACTQLNMLCLASDKK